MSDEHTEQHHKHHNGLANVFPDLFGRDTPKLGVHKSEDFDPETFQRRSSAASPHDPAQAQAHPQLQHRTTTEPPRRTPEEEQAYLAKLASWARDHDSMHAGDGTFGGSYGSELGANAQGLMVGAVSSKQMQEDTTVRRKDGTWDVPESKDSGMGFVDTWKRRLSGQSFKERRASADARAAEYEKEHGYEHSHDPVSRLKDEERTN